MKRPMVGTMALTLGLLCFLAACSSYNVKDSPTTHPDAMPYRQTEAMIAVCVDPYVQSDRAEELFGKDLLAADVIPLHIVVRNLGDPLVRIEAKNFRLVLPGGEVVAPRPASEVAALFDTRGGFFDYAPIGIGLLGRLGGMIGGLVATVVGGVVSGSVKGTQKEVSLARQQDYTRKELKGAALGKNELIRGFLFFTPSTGVGSFDEATLILDVYENDAKATSIKVALKGTPLPTSPLSVGTRPVAPIQVLDFRLAAEGHRRESEL